MADRSLGPAQGWSHPWVKPFLRAPAVPPLLFRLRRVTLGAWVSFPVG